ncbi:MAG: sigma-70 family RNA polymerase sigma factor [Planctomycetales bacterium]|nr:sigma-70 family RNA polymerase sigma factor [Planctomycetales bacterium]MCA9222812.1 sigma-70 family RNA polymerase sigma factor [Planctomycetales bacterium]
MSDSLHTLFPRLQACDEQAATQIFNRFASRLIALARTRLDVRFQAVVDAEDVMQSVWRSFFRRQQAGEFHFDRWDDVWSLLVLMTVRKCARTANALQAARRDVNRQVSAAANPEDDSASWQFMDRQPLPEEAAMLAELVAQLMDKLDERQRQILTMRLQGYSIEEISDEVGRTERTVIRILNHIREQLRPAPLSTSAEAR